VLLILVSLLIFSSIPQITFSVQSSTLISNNGRNKKWEGIWWAGEGNIKKVGEKWFVYKAGEM